MYERISSPIHIGSIELKNRLVFAPMVTNLANSDGTISDNLVEFVRARAKGGVGLVITENTAVNQTGRLFPNTRIDHDDFIPGLVKLFNAVHDEGAKVLIQLDHEGRETTSEATGGLGPIAPSSIPSPTFKVTPREMTLDDITNTQNDFVAAAFRAKKAGADGIELQGAHGFLIHQFLSARTNKRKDKYGGDIENRTRFVVEIITQIKKIVGRDFVICVRISGEDFVEDGLTIDHTIPIVKLLERAGADVIHVSAGVLDALDHIAPPQSFPDVPHANIFKAIREAIEIPVIAVGKIGNLHNAEKLLVEERTDLVAFGRALHADPDLVIKELKGMYSDVLRCERCNHCLNKILSPEPSIECKLHSNESGGNQ